MQRTRTLLIGAWIGAALLAGCGSERASTSAPAAAEPSPSPTPAPAPATYTVGGTITGLGADGLVLANGDDSLSPQAGAATFTMPAALTAGTAYGVSVKTQPPFARCAVSGGSGTMQAAAVTDVAVACTWGAMTTTIAGQVLATGTVDGVGSAARFNRPWGIARDSAGNLIVADSYGHVIRKVTPAGEVTTIAGTGASGANDGPAATATFFRPAGIAVAPDDTIYVVDRLNYRIRKITPQGMVSTFAGSGVQASVDGTGTGASFSLMYGIAIDSQGNLFVGDKSTWLIRKITPAGVVTTVAGSGVQAAVDGVGTAASFAGPGGLAVGPGDVVYIADTNANQIRTLSPDGTVRTLAGSGAAGGADGRGAAAEFYGPYGLTVDAQGVVYVADSVGARIRRISPAGDVTTLAGSGVQGWADGLGSAAVLFDPATITIGADGSLYFTDQANQVVRRLAR